MDLLRNKLMVRLSAFTLIELIVTMALIGLVLMMGNMVHTIIVKQQIQYVQRIDQMSAQLNLIQDIRYELRSCHHLSISDLDQLTLWTEEGIPLCFYQRKDGQTFKYDAGQIDTLKSSWKEILRVGPNRFTIEDSSGLKYYMRVPQQTEAQRIYQK